MLVCGGGGWLATGADAASDGQPGNHWCSVGCAHRDGECVCPAWPLMLKDCGIGVFGFTIVE